MDDQVREITSAYLLSRGTSLDALTTSRQEKILAVVGAVMKRERATADARDSLKANRISIHTIAGDTGISNKTFYSNDLLRDYVEEHATRDDENVTVSRKRLASLERQKADLDEQVGKMVSRDVQVERLRTEVDGLQNEIVERDKRISDLEKELELTRSRLRRAEGGQRGRIISLGKIE